MLPTLTALLLVPIVLGGGMVAAKMIEQDDLDRKRATYKIESFPLEVTEDGVAGWLRAISGTLRPAFFNLGAPPSIVFEVWADKEGITHRIKVPWRHEKYIIRELRSHIPGLRLVEDKDQPAHNWKYAVEVGMKHRDRTLRITSTEEMSRTVTAPLEHLKGSDRVLMQWVITPAVTSDPPEQDKAKTSQFKAEHLIKGTLLASRDEVNERRKKLEEPNLLAVLRVAADSTTDGNAENLADDIRKAITSSRGSKTHFVKRIVSRPSLMKRIENAATPFSFPIQLTLTELIALVGMPIGDSLRPGITVGVSRHLPPSALIPARGRVLGRSNMHGGERDIAVSYESATRHTHCVGRTGVGKTTLLTNMVAQDMEQGYGVIVIEAKDDLFNHAIDRIPTSRIDDVIILDVNDTTRPVGFNIFDQGNSRTAIDELCILIEGMYKDASQSITAPQMLYHITHALAEVPGTTFMDLPAMLTPQSPDEAAWREHIWRQVKDAQVSQYLQRFINMSRTEQDRMTGPLYNRTWQFTSRPEMRYILGQRQSSFNMRDVIKNNKILLVNLSGSRVGPQTASLAGTFLVNAIWQAVRAVTPDKPNFLYIDEFADFMRLPVDIESILAKSRSAKLGMILAHQNLAQISPQLRDGVMANTATKIAFRLSARDANIMVREFGRYVDETDFIGLPQHEAIAMVATDRGTAPPVSIAAHPPGKSTGNTQRARALSQMRYGRAVSDVEREISHRSAPDTGQRKSTRISGEDWGL